MYYNILTFYSHTTNQNNLRRGPRYSLHFMLIENYTFNIILQYFNFYNKKTNSYTNYTETLLNLICKYTNTT